MSSYNKQYADPPFSMSPGIAHTGAAGSQGSRPPAPDDVPAGPVTPPSGVWQDRPDMTTGGTIMAGQLDEGISGVDASFTADSGAGSGRAGHWDRFDWQQQDGPS